MNQGPADLQSAAVTTELYTHVAPVLQGAIPSTNHTLPIFSMGARDESGPGAGQRPLLLPGLQKKKSGLTGLVVSPRTLTKPGPRSDRARGQTAVVWFALPQKNKGVVRFDQEPQPGSNASIKGNGFQQGASGRNCHSLQARPTRTNELGAIVEPARPDAVLHHGTIGHLS